MVEIILIDPPQINIDQMNRHLAVRQKERMRAKIRLKIDCGLSAQSKMHKMSIT